jgi:hypothetical protein
LDRDLDAVVLSTSEAVVVLLEVVLGLGEAVTVLKSSHQLCVWLRSIRTTHRKVVDHVPDVKSVHASSIDVRANGRGGGRVEYIVVIVSCARLGRRAGR